MNTFVKGILLSAIATTGVVTFSAAEANAASINATVTADNFYGIFYGNEDGSTLNFVGRNETGAKGSPGKYNWSEAETWNFEVSANDYLYLVTWDDGKVAESWIGEFEIDGKTVLTGAEDWEYIIGGENPYLANKTANLMPGDAELESLISDAMWEDTVSIGKNGMKPWNTIAGIDGEADWLQTASHTAGKYTIFRTKVPADQVAGVPEPASLLGLLAVGAISGSAALKRQRQA